MSKDNDRYHTFYKEFFGKDVRNKAEQITFNPRPQDPVIIKKNMLIEDIREKVRSSSSIKKHLGLTRDWQHYHNVMASKNNG